MNPETMMPESSAQVSESFNFAAALLECVACGVVVISPTRNLLAFNNAAERFIGLRAADVVGRSSSLLPDGLQAIVDETLIHRCPITARKLRLSPDGGRWLQVSTEIALAGSDVLSVLMEIRDVEQAQDIATNLEHLDRLANLGVLGAGMAHEIKNALVAVRTFVELLQERNKDDELSELVSREILRIDAIIKHVLRGATREEFTLAPLSVHALLNEAVKLLRYQFQARSIQLDVRLQAANDCINGDERQIHHALLNLLINAFEAAGKSARVTITTDEVTTGGRRSIRVVFADTGTGIEPEHLPRIFDPFFTTKKEGTGLGLAITRGIVHGHNGEILVESEPGKGTRFEVLLPLL